jgi:hypothetical protein
MSSQSSLVISWQRIYKSLILSLLVTGWLSTDNWTGPNYDWTCLYICEPHRKLLSWHQFPCCIHSTSHSNGSYLIVATGMCLSSRCLEMGIHVTIPIRPIINWKNAPAYELAKQMLHNHLYLLYTYNVRKFSHLLTALQTMKLNRDMRITYGIHMEQ